MKRTPDPRIVSWTLTGFVVGVILTLIGTGALSHGSSNANAVATLPPARPVAQSQLYSSVYRIVQRQLGTAYPNVKVHRLVELRLDPVNLALYSANPKSVPKNSRSVFIEFRLYDHPLGKAWRLRSAKADVFSLLKSLYTSRLPIYDVQLVGLFPLKSGKTVVDSRALEAFIDHPTAAKIPWKKWGRDNEERLWTLLDYRHLDPRFA
jgi:hypothetical protein